MEKEVLTVFPTYLRLRGWAATSLAAGRGRPLKPRQLIDYCRLTAWGRINRTEFEINFPTLSAIKDGGR